MSPSLDVHVHRVREPRQRRACYNDEVSGRSACREACVMVPTGGEGVRDAATARRPRQIGDARGNVARVRESYRRELLRRPWEECDGHGRGLYSDHL